MMSDFPQLSHRHSPSTAGPGLKKKFPKKKKKAKPPKKGKKKY